MGDRIPHGSLYQYPLSGVQHASPLRSNPLPIDRDRYLTELLAERQKLVPFIQVLPQCYRLISQEIRRVSTLNQGLIETERYEHESPLRQVGPLQGDFDQWPQMHHKVMVFVRGFVRTKPISCFLQENGHLQRMASMGWPTAPIVKRVIRLDVPVEKYPNYNFVGRILGPRGNSLKRVEALTECRVYIRGKGSVKDSIKEEKLKDKPGYEHLNEPLHVLVEAEFPEDIINARLDHAIAILDSLLKPVDESLDHYKKQQLRELAMINGTLREESPSMSPSMSPFNSGGIKRAKTGR